MRPTMFGGRSLWRNLRALIVCRQPFFILGCGRSGTTTGSSDWRQCGSAMPSQTPDRTGRTGLSPPCPARFINQKTAGVPCLKRVAPHYGDLACRLLDVSPANAIEDPRLFLRVVAEAGALFRSDAVRLFLRPRRKVVEEGVGKGGYILFSGCMLPRDSSPRNIWAFVGAGFRCLKDGPIVEVLELLYSHGEGPLTGMVE